MSCNRFAGLHVEETVEQNVEENMEDVTRIHDDQAINCVSMKNPLFEENNVVMGPTVVTSVHWPNVSNPIKCL